MYQTTGLFQGVVTDLFTTNVWSHRPVPASGDGSNAPAAEREPGVFLQHPGDQPDHPGSQHVLPHPDSALVQRTHHP